MEYVPWLVALGILAAGNVWQWWTHRQDIRLYQAQVKDLNDRLMAKVPEQYFSLRLQEQEQELEQPAPMEEAMRMGIPMGPPME